MESTSIKEQILKSIRESLIQKDEDNISEKYEVFTETKPLSDEYPDVLFAAKFSENGGAFHLCGNSKELVSKISNFFHDKKLNTVFCNNEDLGELLQVYGLGVFDKTLLSLPYDYMVMPLDYLIAENGAIVISTKSTKIENIFEKTKHLVLIALTSQVKQTTKEALKLLIKNNTNTFPSQTLILPDPSFQKNLKITLFLRYVS